MKIIRESYSTMAQTRNKYSKVNNGRNAFVIILVIYNDDISNPAELSRFREAFNEFSNSLNKRFFKLFLLSKNEVSEFKIEQIIEDE